MKHIARIFNEEDEIISEKAYTNPQSAVAWARKMWKEIPNAFYWKITKAKE